MEANYSLLTILLGLVMRLALPIVVTLVAVYFLRKLDAHWQAEAERERTRPPEEAQTWDLKDCPIEKRSAHPAAVSALPCWQSHRLPNGYLNEDCLLCEVFLDAPGKMAHAHLHA